MQLEANCGTTAMGIMPHRDVGAALDLAMFLDVPFWPQLPKVGLHEDMYVQASESFPGINVEPDTGKITVDRQEFAADILTYAERMTDPEMFRLTADYSVVYHHFLDQPLGGYRAIRGQQIGPVSFGFKVVDDENRPIIYDEEMRTILYDFMGRKLDVQYRELRERNANAFVWLDEPGLGWVFSGLTGYDDVQARKDYGAFIEGLEGPPALHLCANVNLPYLLSLGIEVLSFDAFQIDIMPRAYASAVAAFIEKGGIISWGIVPADSFSLDVETPETLTERLGGYWQVIADNSSVDQAQIARQALIAPARCLLKDAGLVGAPGETADGGSRPAEAGRRPAEAGRRPAGREEDIVAKAFGYLGDISARLRCRFGV